MFADVSFPISTYRVFTYSVPRNLEDRVKIGVRVSAPFGARKKVQGVVVDLRREKRFKGKTHPISAVVDETPIFDKALWDLLNWVSRHYLTPMGQVMRTAVPSRLTSSYSPPEQLMVRAVNGLGENLSALAESSPRQHRAMKFLKQRRDSIPVAALTSVIKNPWDACRALERKGYVTLARVPRIPDVSDLSFLPIQREIHFTPAQEKIMKGLEAWLEKKKFTPCLLHGVTGSGKTEIYIHLARRAELQGRRSLILLPEISLTPQIAGRFRSVFGDRVAIWHSRMTSAERAWTWKQICEDRYGVIVGARSAIFSPVRSVGLIVVDEEQESAFKQESPAPRYHARDVALMRGKLCGALTILAGATPSLESYYNQAVGKLSSIRLKTRYGGASYPQVDVVNMTEERGETGDYDSVLSRLLIEKIGERLKKGEQAILLQNRRGFSSILYCGDCGHVEMCRNCRISLTFHKAESVLKCHYCNFQKSLPRTCQECGGTELLLLGAGTQKVEEGLRERFPGLRLVRMDLDTTRRKGAYTRILTKFAEGDYDILLGTQMVAKGLHFENVTLVGIINADTGLYLPDFRAGERTFQLIYQVAGRSGRGEKPGEVVIQTSNPDNPAISCASRLDLERYYNICLSEREELTYPPFSWLAKIEFSGREREAVEREAIRFGGSMVNKPEHISALGPAPCPIERIKNNFRYQIIFKSPKKKDENGSKLHRFLENVFVNSSFSSRARGMGTYVDVDPASLL
ncbi:MAG: primosomal protein N' [Candidatus Neomarinimicrobiota bacterium]